MSECLVIRLDPAPRDTASWVAVDETGALLGAGGHGTLAEAAAVSAGRLVIALLPAQEVLRVRADVPVKSSGKLLQALPFALEEQLAEDVDVLHFAASPRDPDGRVPVAVVRRESMEAWTTSLAAAGLTPHRMYSEADAVGGMPNTTTLLVQDDGAILAEPDGGVTPIELDGIESLLDLWLARRAETDSDAAPLHLVVYGPPARLDHLEPVWQTVRSRVESLDLRTLKDGALPRLAAQIVTAPGVNLLQGPYAQRSSLMALWPAWRLAAVLLATLSLLALAGQILDIRRLKGEITELDGAIDQAFHYVFPDAGPVQDARAQLSSRLQQLGDQGPKGSHEFLDALRVIAQALNNSTEIRIEAINYRAGAMELRVRAPNVESLDRIQQQVTQGGSLKAQIQSANAAGNEVIGRLQITRAGG